MSKQQKNIKPFFVYLEGEKVKITKKMIDESAPEVIEVYRKILWQQAQKEKREKRCFNPDGTKCRKQCATCARIQRIDLEDPCNGLPRSLEEMEKDQCSLPHSDTFISPEDYVVQQETNHELYTAIEALDGQKQDIIKRYYFEEQTEREIGKEIGKVQGTVNYQKNKSHEELEKIMKEHF